MGAPTSPFLLNAVVMAACFTLLWLLSLRLKDVSYIDSWWAFGLALLALLAFAEGSTSGARRGLLVTLTLLWGVRLGIYIFWRWRKHGPDPRYQEIIAHAKSARGWSFAKTSGLQIFGLQAILQFIVSLPVQLGQWDNEPELGAMAIAGGVLAVFGFLFETVADAQLVHFKADPANKGKVLDRGLWRYTRHPNYFGEFCFWWGAFLIAAQTPLGQWSIPGPLVVSWLLLRISGVPMLEASMQKKPDHAAYAARTSNFFPWFPTKA